MATKTTIKVAPSTTTSGGKTYSKGESFTDSAGRTGAVGFSAETGQRLSDPVSSSTSIRADNNALGNDISGLSKAYKQERAQIQAEQAALAERRLTEVQGIKTDFDIAKQAQDLRQEGDYAGRSTQLVTSGGGFLGATQSQQGVLQNLKGTFDTEKSALMAKREAAINAANQAYEDKDFALARELSKNARDLQSEIYSRQKDVADQALRLSSETRAQSTFERSFADDKAKAYAMLSDDEYKKLTPMQKNEVDKFFTPGYMDTFRKINQEVAKGKTIENDLLMRGRLQTLINNTPAGQKITLADGTSYMGMKKPTSSSISGIISPSIATQLGVPSLAGKDESDVILSLNLKNAPQWYREYYKQANPQGWELIKNNSNMINMDWEIFKSQPDIEAYKNSSVVTKRVDDSGSILDGLSSTDDDAAIFDE